MLFQKLNFYAPLTASRKYTLGVERRRFAKKK